ncbi:Sec-independent protein translocase protein TatB [Sulfurovum sp. XGS-02]|uniref:Sec-independent protein translocase protein TatB n=1 Tax=Sulfurovum sp. XGS-02 TaxID=2925411 RepID=UPI002046DFEA|nr:Sec-independent protein translocase protein TatB [Sulfurovum sp. XGS-02]UPT77930.1 Sec-independent protein translocase protein TatB [Sulfurovum sp. XGS-02]
MFGIGFTELLLISIVAILFLGPDKLPQAMIEVAKFIKGVKKTVSEAKSSLEEEMKIADLKEEALNYKKQLDEATNELRNFKNIDFDEFEEEISTESPKTITKESHENEPKTKEASKEDDKVATQVEAKNDTVTFTKPKKQKKKEATDETTDKPEGDA